MAPLRGLSYLMLLTFPTAGAVGHMLLPLPGLAAGRRRDRLQLTKKYRVARTPPCGVRGFSDTAQARHEVSVEAAGLENPPRRAPRVC